ncbi:hypothetical protein TanjilG_14271 [Lupinus angustifolius]|uniref:Uncharacterized protein n=1 Tax=Lupinus angustifolius TaxID=3871 RepID=A0A1J7HAW3_LUPAN|nr:hypothetical protein TanjilG_14271 [Lupinus angustifolius]
MARSRWPQRFGSRWIMVVPIGVVSSFLPPLGVSNSELRENGDDMEWWFDGRR